MAIREILEAPDARLKVVSEPVTRFDDELKTLVEDMFETMYDAPGIGLAAIQVGVPLRVLVIDLQPEDPDAEPVACNHDGHHHHHQPTKKEPRVFINPEVLDPSEEEFRALFQIMAPKLGIRFEQSALDHLVNNHYKAVKRPFRCCQPRDLLLQIVNYCHYISKPAEMTVEYFDYAVANYFAVM